MYLLVIFLPLCSSISIGFFGRLIGFYGSSYISTICLFLSFIISSLIFFEVSLNGHIVYIELTSWIISDDINIKWNFLFDNLTSLMLIIVTFISMLVHLYTLEYMKLDPHFQRFVSFLGIFTFFMLILVTSGNLLQLFVGWEGVGLASYLLINFWFTRLAANKAALKALIVNRIGDLGVLFAILLLLQVFDGTLDFIIIFSLVPLINEFFIYLFAYQLHYVSFISFFLIIGAIGKSAQLGLHTWLPDAMEGPTPVSALIHAATMVTAGVFLIIRFSPLIEFSQLMLNFLTVIGAFTAFFAAFTGIFQHDIKKVIAYSTCSQLGYMIFCCGLSHYNISLFHLFNHAFFKALLFLSAGSIIHCINDEQDMRRMGSLLSFLPITYSVMLIGSLALTGFPFLTGFYSKDVILEITCLFRNSNLSSFFGIVACWLGILAAFFTSFYSFRLLYLTFFNNVNISRKFAQVTSESSYLTILVLSLLAFCSMFIGYFFKEFFLGLGTDCWINSIFIWPKNHYFLESEFLDTKYKWFPFIFTSLGFFLATFLNVSNLKFLLNLKFFHFFFFLINKKWFFDFIFNRIFVYPLLTFGYLISYKNLDRGFLELIGPFGLSFLTKKVANFFIFLQTGQITHYICYISISLFFLFFYCICLPSYISQLFIIFFITIFYIL
uniref:NADH dehydrogenase subunit 5 n=1 Tax=Symphyocladia marchantioides TaxID=88360 RepID=UPI0022FD6A9C|nr:NADH dehydrogenase subunit 5 [Symphyocladia marchantioides]WAX04058.1 NADH dehydrogenase subunit 5 [Symphyocladia marchantioides]